MSKEKRKTMITDGPGAVTEIPPKKPDRVNTDDKPKTDD